MVLGPLHNATEGVVFMVTCVRGEALVDGMVGHLYPEMLSSSGALDIIALSIPAHVARSPMVAMFIVHWAYQSKRALGLRMTAGTYLTRLAGAGSAVSRNCKVISHALAC